MNPTCAGAHRRQQRSLYIYSKLPASDNPYLPVERWFNSVLATTFVGQPVSIGRLELRYVAERVSPPTEDEAFVHLVYLEGQSSEATGLPRRHVFWSQGARPGVAFARLRASQRCSGGSCSPLPDGGVNFWKQTRPVRNAAWVPAEFTASLCKKPKPKSAPPETDSFHMRSRLVKIVATWSVQQAFLLCGAFQVSTSLLGRKQSRRFPLQPYDLAHRQRNETSKEAAQSACPRSKSALMR